MRRVLIAILFLLPQFAPAADDNAVPASPRWVWREVRDELKRAADLIRGDRTAEGVAVIAAAKVRHPRYLANVWPEHFGSQLRQGHKSEQASVWLLLGDYSRALSAAIAAEDRSMIAYCQGMTGEFEAAAEFYQRRADELHAEFDHDLRRAVSLLKRLQNGAWNPRLELDFVRLHILDSQGNGPTNNVRRTLDALTRWTNLLEKVDDPKLRREAFEGIQYLLAQWEDEPGCRAWENHAVKNELWITANDKAGYLSRRGSAAFKTRDFAEAEKQWRRVCVDYPRSSSYGVAQYNVGSILQQRKEYAAAIDEYAKLFDSDVNDLDQGPHIMEFFRNYRHQAAVRTAQCYESLEKFDVAAEWVIKSRDVYRYQSMCGTCQDQSNAGLKRYLNRLQLKAVQLPMPEPK